MYLQFPAYMTNMCRLGFSDNDLVVGGSNRLIASASDDLEASMYCVRAHHEAGGDHITLHALISKTGFSRQEWRELASLIH